MALSSLNNLYKMVIAEHSQSPHHHGFLEGVEQLQLNNPTCGDVINLLVMLSRILPLLVTVVLFRRLLPA